MGDKNVEEQCLNLVNRIKKYTETQGKDIRDNKERPDFVFNEVGIEHFFVDIFTFDKKQSLQRKQSNHKNKKIQFYKENPLKIGHI